MHCPYCNSTSLRVIETTHDARGGIRRRRECRKCDARFSTYERLVMATPLLIKQDGRREEFDRDKLLQGLRISCAKRPVPGAELDRLVREVEVRLQQMGKSEVNSKIVGDMVMARLKELDQVAYIRYAIVYLGLEDLKAVRSEIDRLLAA